MISCPLNINLWLDELMHNEDSAFLSNGIANGFLLAPETTKFAAVDMDNYKSATNPVTRPLVEQTICEEIQEGNYVLTSDKPQIVSALGGIP